MKVRSGFVSNSSSSSYYFVVKDRKQIADSPTLPSLLGEKTVIEQSWYDDDMEWHEEPELQLDTKETIAYLVEHGEDKGTLAEYKQEFFDLVMSRLFQSERDIQGRKLPLEKEKVELKRIAWQKETIKDSEIDSFETLAENIDLLTWWPNEDGYWNAISLYFHEVKNISAIKGHDDDRVIYLEIGDSGGGGVMNEKFHEAFFGPGLYIIDDIPFWVVVNH